MTTHTPQCMSSQITLERGPSADRLIDAFKYAYDKDHPMHVVFTDEFGHEIRVHVQQLAHEDGSGQSIMFAGGVVWTTIDLPFKASNVSGNWHGQTRRGFLYLSSNHLPLGGSNS